MQWRVSEGVAFLPSPLLALSPGCRSARGRQVMGSRAGSLCRGRAGAGDGAGGYRSHQAPLAF